MSREPHYRRIGGAPYERRYGIAGAKSTGAPGDPESVPIYDDDGEPEVRRSAVATHQMGSTDSESVVEMFRSVLRTRAGRRLIWWLLDRAGLFATSYTGDDRTIFREGRRDLGLQVLSWTHRADPEAYVDMLREARITAGDPPHPEEK